jgi:hypothetical protein
MPGPFRQFMAEQTAEGGGMVSRERHEIGVVAFRAKFFRGLFAIFAHNLEEAAVVFIVGDPAGFRLPGDEHENANYDGNQSDKEPITFFDGHVQTSLQGME